MGLQKVAQLSTLKKWNCIKKLRHRLTAVATKIRTHLSVVIGVISFKLGY